MTGEHDGMDPEEQYRNYRRFMDALGREGLQRLIEHLTEAVEANPRDTEALSARGLAYSELGGHRRAAEDYGRVIALHPDDADAYIERARAYSEMDELRAAVEDYGRHHPPGSRQCRGALQPWGMQRRAGRPRRGNQRLRRGHPPGPR